MRNCPFMDKKASKDKRITIACDHAGFELKRSIIKYFQLLGYGVTDHGCDGTEAVDYPDYAAKVARDVSEGKFAHGVLICGTGIGMAISANKFKGVRATSVTDIFSLEMARRHNDVNVLCFGGRVVGLGLAQKLVDAFLGTEFEGGRHARRVEKIKEIES